MTLTDNYTNIDHEQHLRTLLHDRGRDINLAYYLNIDSTNSEAKRRLLDGGITKTTLVVASEQSAGKGRLGRSFYSPAKSGLYMSLVYRTDADISHSLKVTPAAAVAASESISTITGKQPKIKWVNDLYMDGAKVGGILCESTVCGSDIGIIVGIGINLTTEYFPDGMRSPVTSLYTAKEALPDQLADQLASDITDRLLSLIESNFPRKMCLEKYRARSYLDGKNINCICGSESHNGTALGIDEDFRLIMKTDTGQIKHIASGEATVKIIL